MRTLVEISRMRAGGSLLEKRKAYSKSFTQGLFDQMYVESAVRDYTYPYVTEDITGALVNIDYGRDASYTNYMHSGLQVGGPGCSGQIIWLGSYESSSSGRRDQACQPEHFLPCDSYGIVIGSGTGAVAPNQRYIEQQIFHGMDGAISVAQDFDNWTNHTSTVTVNSSILWRGICVWPKKGFRLTAVRFLLYRLNNPGTMELHVRRIVKLSATAWKMNSTDLNGVTTSDGNTLPTGSPYELREFALPSSIDLHPGMGYAIMIGAPAANGSNYVGMRYDSTAYTVATSWQVERACYGSSADSGATLSYSATNLMYYALRGTSLGEVQYGGCDIYGLTVANPNASFSIGRLFRNLSGSTLTINEIGLYGAVGQAYYASEGGILPYAVCLARDLVSPAISLGNTEMLLVTYTPQITV